MMNPMRGWIQRFAKPEYIYRPRQALLRLIRWNRPSEATWTLVELPWGSSLEVNLAETIGHSLWHLGVYELAVSEVLWRLIDEGDNIADVGANIGYMSSLMAVRAGECGQVCAFEPHPLLYRKLCENVRRMFESSGHAQVHTVNLAIADRSGEGKFEIPTGFSANHGIAALSSQGISVGVVSLREFYQERIPPRLIKIDIEGHEASAIEGAGDLISPQGPVRDVIFEDHGCYPSKAIKSLETRGYTIFQIRRTFRGPMLFPKDSPIPEKIWEPMNYLATQDPSRVKDRMTPRGWRTLSV